MKTFWNFSLVAVIAASVCPLAAQTFNSGSDGSYGPMNITSNTTLNMPSNGVFNCTTINVASGATLKFNKNPLNTPLYLLATGDVVVNGTIDLSATAAVGGEPGRAGPGGFDGGYGGFGVGANTIGGDGQGPGGAKNSPNNPYPSWGAAYGSAANNNTNVYGNALNSPLIGGSGGSGGNGNPGGGGGGGGGAILIASNTSITNTGSINCNGGAGNSCSGTGGPGSGGAIRLVSPIVAGNGTLSTSGACAPCWGCNYGSASGRIRIDCTNSYAFRSLVMNGFATRGSQMFVFPPTIPRLDIIQAAGQSIPARTNSNVVINLPAGSPTNHTVTVQARDFTNNVPIQVAVVPENRPSSNYLATITMTNNPSQVVVNVVIPDGTISRIQAWTR